MQWMPLSISIKKSFPANERQHMLEKSELGQKEISAIAAPTIYDKLMSHKIRARLPLIWEDYSRERKENHDARYDSQHLKKEYLKDHSNCKFPAGVQQENVLVSILHQADEVRLKKPVRKSGREMLSNQSK